MMERLDDPERRRELEEHLASWPHAEMLPWISAILVDRGGRVWAREYRPPFDPSPVAWGVFDAGGRWLGRVEMPAAFRPTEIGPDFVLGIERDELGVEYVRRYELRRGDR